MSLRDRSAEIGDFHGGDGQYQPAFPALTRDSPEGRVEVSRWQGRSFCLRWKADTADRQRESSGRASEEVRASVGSRSPTDRR